MHVETERAVKIVETAARFDWTWTVADLERICQTFGWQVAARRRLGATLTTGLNINYARVSVALNADTLRQLTVWISDVAETFDVSVGTALADGFLEIEARLAEILGEPSRITVGEMPSSGWDTAAAVIFLTASRKALRLEIVSPDTQRQLDIPESSPRIWRF